MVSSINSNSTSLNSILKADIDTFYNNVTTTLEEEIEDINTDIIDD